MIAFLVMCVPFSAMVAGVVLIISGDTETTIRGWVGTYGAVAVLGALAALFGKSEDEQLDERQDNRAERAAFAEREREERERTKAINQELGALAKPQPVPNIDRFGQSRPSLPSNRSANRPRLGVTRPQFDDPDVVEGEATDIPNTKGLFSG